MRESFRSLLFVALLVACEEGGASPPIETAGNAVEPAIDVEVPIIEGPVRAAEFDLEGTAALVRDNRAKDGKSLEKQINASKRNKVDVDRDGKRDRLQVVEVRDGDDRTFVIRAIPSSTPKGNPDQVGVAVATIAVTPRELDAEVMVTYAEAVVVEAPVVITFDVEIVVDTFCHWVLIVDRPIFVGLAYVVVDVDVHHRKHRKHKHKKHKKW